MSLPPKRVRPRSGIQRVPAKVWPKHKRWVRSHACCVPECQGQPIEFAHVRSAENSGTGTKPHDRYGVSLCREHHREQHTTGVETFQRRYGIDLWVLAAEFYRRSPDRMMKAALNG